MGYLFNGRKEQDFTNHTLRKDLYDNIGLYSPDNTLMAYINYDKLNFYLEKDLVECIDEKKYRLKFEPKGLGYTDEDSVVSANCLIPRENRCVVTGETDFTKLTRHHIVPSYFRVHFPIKEKSSFEMVVLLEARKHFYYTQVEHKFYDELAKMFDVETETSITKRFSAACNKIKLVDTLYRFGLKLPPDVKAEKEALFIDIYDMPATIENYRKIINTPTSYYTPPEPYPPLSGDRIIFKNKRFTQAGSEFDFGKLLASKIVDYRAFEGIWLAHFIKIMKPKYLPEDLKITWKLA